MKKYLIYIILLFLPVVNMAVSTKDATVSETNSDIYTLLKLADKGLSSEAFILALKGHNKLQSEGKLQKPNILTVIDFSQPSSNKRMYIIDLKKKELLENTYVAHGRNTGDEFANSFSNSVKSHKSSLGFYVTKNQNQGKKVGLSILLNGIEKGVNDNALKREIIIHGADYATEDYIKKYGRLGRSFGCPSVPPSLIDWIVQTIKDGTCIFIYQKDENYIRKSSVLN